MRHLESLPETPTVARLRGLIADSKQAGVSMRMGSTVEGINSIAAPIRSPRGTVAAAIVAAGPAHRFGRKAMEQSRVPLEACAAAIAAAMFD